MPVINGQEVPSGFDPGNPEIKYGVWGDSANGDGVIGSSGHPGVASGTGVTSGAGVLGLNNQARGVGVLGWADNATGVAVMGISQGTGVSGQATGTEPGVTGTSTYGPGVSGTSTNDVGVKAASTNGSALHARREDASGAVTEARLATPEMAADFSGNVKVSGNTKMSGALAVDAKIGVRTTAPTHPLHVSDVQGIRQNDLYLNGGPGWSSLSYNAYHKQDNNNWIFPDPTRPAVTIEIDDNRGGAPRFEVFSTTKENTTGWIKRLAINGQTGEVTVPGNLTVGTDGHVKGQLTVDNRLIAHSQTYNAVCGTTDSGTALVAYVSGSGTALLAGGRSELHGDVHVSGTLTTDRTNFVIDHPLDPENKHLVHASIESSERANIYSGNVVLDDNGEATVKLPDWIEALNKDFRYQLTCVGQAAPVYIAQEISGGAFVISGGVAGLKVSWQLTGIRDDAWARNNQLVVEEEKPDSEKGFFRHPELFGRDLTSSVHYRRHEELIKRNPRVARQLMQTRGLKPQNGDAK